MKIYRHLKFLLVLSLVFLIIYPQSDEKGLQRWLTSFRTAVISAAATTSLFFSSTDEAKTTKINHQEITLVKSSGIPLVSSRSTALERGQPN